MILLLFILLYVILILWIAHHWFHNAEYQASNIASNTKVSVLIPFRNEAHNIPLLKQALLAQTYPKSLIDYVFINDHSIDNGKDLLAGFQVLESEGEGKKAALKTGFARARGELLVTLDADCLPEKDWLQTLISFFESKKSDLIICPVRITPTQNLWGKIQALEFQSLAASTAGAALGRKPIMCNGANLAFRKTLVDTEEDVFNEKYVSGDDMFLLEFAKAKMKKIDYLKSRKAMVSTAPESWSAFWKQRSRWTSKSGAYADLDIILSGLIVLMANLSLLVLPFFNLPLFLIALLAKGTVDLVLLFFSASFFRTLNVLWLYPFLMLIYPVYVLYALMRGMFAMKLSQ